ncbi:hypothetical protein LEN26_003121 [Aphanomyces euteiches]|nr:hypothetical protein AeMF1_006933 [Aphanomyces euteiches]KAH9158232.1 hypothetical protein LEN26_003121 [Aphanomyces euteiches]KAH9181145.1 hypothetical protein AeNC1_016879 [Aphanomyces euteiches]
MKNGKIIEGYHATFNHDFFETWFEFVIKEVESMGYDSVVFVMDNAKYHKGLPLSTPKGSWSKLDLFKACVKYGINGITMNDILKQQSARISSHIEEHVPPVFVDMARARGHHLVYTLPNFSEL